MTAESAEQGAQSERVQDLHPADHAEAQEQAQYAAATRWNSDKITRSKTATQELNYWVETESAGSFVGEWNQMSGKSELSTYPLS